MPVTIPTTGLQSTDSLAARNSTQINLAIALTGNSFTRVGRVQSMSKDTSNNVQVLMEIGSQYAVELKKGISTYSFSIAKFYVHTDVFDQLENGQVFALQTTDAGAASTDPAIIDYFSSCALNTVSRSYQQGQATVAENASVVVIGQNYGNPD